MSILFFRHLYGIVSVISMASHRFTENGVLPAEIKGVIV
jgi:hypothetical protein